jgi:leucine dehydrogenase
MFKQIEAYGHEGVYFGYDEETGMKAIIAVHNTVLGPALGGTRMWDYASDEEAIYDVLRLSRGMTLKSSAAGLKLGGGKAVIIGDPAKLKNEKFLLAYGRFVETLGGKYITAEDVNIGEADAEIMAKATKHVVGLPGKSGDPSPFTSRGVYRGMKAAALEVFGTDDLKGKVVAVQGLGKVGYYLCKHLRDEGAVIIGCDINQANIDRALAEVPDIKVVSPDEILTVDCDIFAPCALGAIINKDNVSKLKCKLVCGGANNVLVDNDAGEALVKAGILYAPDYIVNAGGVINVAEEAYGVYCEEAATKQVDNIYETTKDLIAFAKKENMPMHLAADVFAMKRINEAKTK